MQYTRHGDVELAYEVHGAADAPTLLLIMGINLRSAHWGTHFLKPLAERYRVVVFDNRGTGDSTKAVAAITAALWAGDALAVLDAVGAEQAHVLGYSMGGRIAQQLVVHHPQRVRRLLLMASAVGGPKAVPPTDSAVLAMMPQAGETPEQMRRRSLVALTNPDFPSRHPERLRALVDLGGEKRTPMRVLQQQLAVIGEHVTEHLPAVRHPTRIIHGDADTLVPFGNGQLLQQLMPQADFHRLDGVGHLPHWEAPERLLPAITDFLG